MEGGDVADEAGERGEAVEERGEAAARRGEAAGRRGEAGDAVGTLHSRSFKLRFATQRELGRSYVSPVKPLSLPATVTEKFYRLEREGVVDEAAVERALQRIRDAFGRDVRRLYRAPLTETQQYGWHSDRASSECARDRRLQHHIRDSEWLKARLRVLAHDDKLKRG